MVTRQCQTPNTSYKRCLILFIANKAGYSEAQDTRIQMHKGFMGRFKDNLH